MKILLGSDTYPPDVNGAARFAERLATGLAGRGHEIHVVAPSPTGPASREVRDGVTVHGVRSHRYYQHEGFQVCMPWEAFPAAAALMNEIDPDVVHTNAHMVVGRGVVRAAHRTGRPLVATNHLMPENLVGYSPIPRPLQRLYIGLAWRDLGRVFGKAQVVTAPTPRAVELLVRRAGLVDAVPVSNGIDADRYRAVPHTPGPVPTALFVGRLDPEKRVDELIRAFAALPTGLPGRLEIVGDGGRREDWTALAAELGLGERVCFRGFVSDQELLEAYARADMFCMPGVAELQSLVTLEAMAAGLPVVAANAMALPHLVHDGENGYLFAPSDPEDLAAKLRRVLEATPDEYRTMKEASIRLIAAHDIQRTISTFESLYRGKPVTDPVTDVASAALPE